MIAQGSSFPSSERFSVQALTGRRERGWHGSPRHSPSSYFTCMAALCRPALARGCKRSPRRAHLGASAGHYLGLTTEQQSCTRYRGSAPQHRPKRRSRQAPQPRASGRSFPEPPWADSRGCSAAPSLHESVACTQGVGLALKCH